MISSRRTLSWTNVLGSQLATTAGKRAQARQKIQHMQMDGTSFPGSAVREGWSWDRNVAQHFACMHCWERCKYELARRRQASEMENAAKWRINAAARALHTKLVRRQCQCRIYSRRRQLLELVLIKLEASVGYCVCWLVGWLIDWLIDNRRKTYAATSYLGKLHAIRATGVGWVPDSSCFVIVSAIFVWFLFCLAFVVFVSPIQSLLCLRAFVSVLTTLAWVCLNTFASFFLCVLLVGCLSVVFQSSYKDVEAKTSCLLRKDRTFYGQPEADRLMINVDSHVSTRSYCFAEKMRKTLRRTSRRILRCTARPACTHAVNHTHKGCDRQLTNGNTKGKPTPGKRASSQSATQQNARNDNQTHPCPHAHTHQTHLQITQTKTWTQVWIYIHLYIHTFGQVSAVTAHTKSCVLGGSGAPTK